MQTNGQLEHTGDAHWVEAIATALGAIRKLAEQQENISEDIKDSMLQEQKQLARAITRNSDGRYSNPEHVSANDIERAQRAMADYQKNIEHHDTLAAAYRAAAAILEAASGEYHYAARDGWYNTEVVKFETAEDRDAFLKVANPNAGWRKANEGDLERIYWASVVPTTGTVA